MEDTDLKSKSMPEGAKSNAAPKANPYTAKETGTGFAADITSGHTYVPFSGADKNITSGSEISAVNFQFKDRLFKMIFSDKRELLSLYNAVNGSSYTNPDKLQINTLENAVYMSMRNDISFIFDMSLSLYEHQSTVSPNLPFRFLMYISNLYSRLTKDLNIYSSTRLRLPTPRFVIFYNGAKAQPDKQILKLSDLFMIPLSEPSLELKALMLNINKGHNEDLMNACRTLGDYAEFASRMREYTGHMSLDDAAERAITECIREGILAEFLSANRAEAKKVTIFEYDAEKHMKMEREESYQMGYRSGQESGFASGMALTKNVIRLSESGLSYSEIALKENVSEDIIRSILQ